MKDQTPGRLFVVAAPSGAGKTSLLNALLKAMPELSVAVSHTTRPKRAGEEDGVNYHFVSRDQFQDMLAQQAFLESATVFGNLYGTSRAEVDRITAAGQHVVLEIDWQGARQIREVAPSVTSIFILPPSLEILKERLLGRAQDDSDSIATRTAEAMNEISHYGEFDYLVVNDDFEVALAELAQIIRGDGDDLKTAVQRRKLAPLLSELLPPSVS